MHAAETPLCYRYTLLSAADRRIGGQGAVQFPRIANTSTAPAAIKFYLHRSPFEAEPASGAPPGGDTLPPFVIIERGQSLDEWAAGRASDSVTIFQALSHSVRALRKLHSAGYAHRDVQPGNILRRPKQHDWTLIDFGGAADELAQVCAPRVAHAVESGDRTVPVAAVVDMRAVGVIAWELLTGSRAFPAPRTSAVVRSAGQPRPAADAAVLATLGGRAPLPWERGAARAAGRLRMLRGLQRTVLRCLDRDPARRPSAVALLQSWDHVFDDMRAPGSRTGFDVSVGSAECTYDAARLKRL
eukprot:jgi/Ulvmu1/6399/UM003_0027.1